MRKVLQKCEADRGIIKFLTNGLLEVSENLTLCRNGDALLSDKSDTAF